MVSHSPSINVIDEICVSYYDFFFTQQHDVDLEVDVPGLEATMSYRHRMASENLCSDTSATLGGAPFFAGHEMTFLQPTGPSDVLALLPVDATPLSTMRLYDDCR